MKKLILIGLLIVSTISCEDFEGWNCPLAGVTAYGDLPRQARVYLEALARHTDAPLWLVSAGPRRDQSILLPS